ncbi:MAG TPA: glycosyltransferase [Rhodanobacteraceae bacterium]|jgi:glycosyltransferase involved in cell wall biosynthesis|nr:glycosyltransferase [Rhodanobacteraceae bacterium]
MLAPLVTAIVPVYNGERFLAQAVDSALAQTMRDLEIVIVDDGSTDGSGALADGYGSRYPGIVRVHHQSNQGLCHARNAALRIARGEYMALLDADDVWLPHHLEESVAVLHRHRQVALVHADIERIDIDGNSLGCATRQWNHLHADAFRVLFLRHEHVCCPTAVFRRDAIGRTGNFDPRFNRLGCEDRDLWLRIAGLAPISYLDNVHARYRLHGANMSANFSKMLQARMLLVDKFAATPKGRALRRQALAAAHCNLGDELMDAARRGAAFAAYARAFAVRPIESKALRGMLRSLLKPQPPARPPLNQ